MVLCPNSDGIVRVGEIARSMRWQAIGYDHSQITDDLLVYEWLFAVRTPPESPSCCQNCGRRRHGRCHPLPS
jgi:hypothetical protein